MVINDIPSWCADDCSFTWSQDLTPVLASVFPASGPSDTLITLTGTGLLQDSAGNVTVVIGGAVCDVVTATDHEVQCTAGEGEFEGVYCSRQNSFMIVKCSFLMK